MNTAASTGQAHTPRRLRRIAEHQTKIRDYADSIRAFEKVDAVLQEAKQSETDGTIRSAYDIAREDVQRRILALDTTRSRLVFELGQLQKF